MLFEQIESQLAILDSQHLRRTRRIVETPCAPRVTIDGKAILAFSSNDYLGLASHPKIMAALHEGIELYGVGSGASHLISGHSRAHVALEERLANFISPHIENAAALSFSTGYMDNLAILSGLASLTKGAAGGVTEIFSESLNHASLIDGVKLAGAKLNIYPHADVNRLAEQLSASTATNKIVVTDSVFSMDGNLAPLPEILALCEQFQAWLVIDDAHGFGMLGEHGRGVLEHFNLHSKHIIYMGTLGKAAGVGGAFVVAHASVIEWFVQSARAYVYTTAAPPALAHALLTSLDMISSDEGITRRNHLHALIHQLRAGLSGHQWKLLPSSTAIQPLIIGTNEATMRAAGNLYAQGIWVPAIRPPTVELGTGRLRITLSASHSAEDVVCLVDALNQLVKN